MMTTIDELPDKYKEIAKRHQVKNDGIISSAFPWANTPEGHSFWNDIYREEDEESLPPIPNIDYTSFKKKFFAAVTIDAGKVMADPVPLHGCGYLWVTSRGEYTYYVEPVTGSKLDRYYRRYYKPVVTINNIIKKY